MNKRTLLVKFAQASVMVCIALASHANADDRWTYVITSGNDTDIYADLGSIKVRGNVYYWTLSDDLTPDKSGYLSSLSLNELVCSAPQQMRIVSSYYYALPMAQGEAVHNNTVSPWFTVNPDAPSEYVADAVCSAVN